MAEDDIWQSAGQAANDALIAEIAAMPPSELEEFLALIVLEGNARAGERAQAAADRKEWRRRQN